MPYYVMQDGEALFVREFGQGQPVLVLSGLGMSSWQWWPFLACYAQQYQFIIPDWRGFAGSKHCRISASDAITQHWQDLNRLIQTQHLLDCVVIAYSMGASVAMHGMRFSDFSSKIKSYLHIDQSPKISCELDWPYGLYGSKHTEFKQHLFHLSDFLQHYAHIKHFNELTEEQKQQFYKFWLAFMKFQGSVLHLPLKKLTQYFPNILPDLLPIKKLGYLKWYIDTYLYHQYDYREALYALDCPCYFVIGKHSQLYSAHGQKHIATQCKHAYIFEFQRSGHAPLFSQPLAFYQVLKQFFSLNHEIIF